MFKPSSKALNPLNRLNAGFVLRHIGIPLLIELEHEFLLLTEMGKRSVCEHRQLPVVRGVQLAASRRAGGGGCPAPRAQRRHRLRRVLLLRLRLQLAARGQDGMAPPRAMHKLRIVALGFGMARKRMALE